MQVESTPVFRGEKHSKGGTEAVRLVQEDENVHD